MFSHAFAGTIFYKANGTFLQLKSTTGEQRSRSLNAVKTPEVIESLLIVTIAGIDFYMYRRIQFYQKYKRTNEVGIFTTWDRASSSFSISPILVLFMRGIVFEMKMERKIDCGRTCSRSHSDELAGQSGWRQTMPLKYFPFCPSFPPFWCLYFCTLISLFF